MLKIRIHKYCINYRSYEVDFDFENYFIHLINLGGHILQIELDWFFSKESAE